METKIAMIKRALANLRSRANGPAPLLLVLLAALVWNAWSMLGDMQRKWINDPTYQHGWLVPVFAVVILWLRRDRLPAAAAQPQWWALALIGLGAAMQLGGTYYYIRWIAGASLLAYLAGIAALAAGWSGVRWAAPAIGFLVFMIPLPYRYEVAMQQPLRRVSTVASAYLLQTMGLPAMAEGNVILLRDVELGIVDACSGLKMLMVFFALATAVAFLIHRPVGDKILVVLSAAPIAILANVARITITGVMHETAGAKWADLVFHDLAGWLMMPMALALLWGELALSSLLVIETAVAPPPPPLLPVAPVPTSGRARPDPVGAGP
jgi:exosortase